MAEKENARVTVITMGPMQAMEVLKEGNVRRENRKQYVDKIAATFILQGYLDSLQK